MNANRMMLGTEKQKVSITEKLSSGYKINRSADDAAGLAVSEKLRRQIRGLSQATTNVQDGVSYVQVADGALNEAHDLLQRMNELSVQAVNGTLTDTDREYIDKEVQQLKSEIDRIFETTSFNEEKIWDAGRGHIKQIGTEHVQAVKVTSTNESFTINNQNAGYISANGYTIKADADPQKGVSVTWKGYDGKEYTSPSTDWDTLKANQFQISIVEGKTKEQNGTETTVQMPNYTIRMDVNELATYEDFKKSMDGIVFSSGASQPIQADLISGGTGVSVSSRYLSYEAAYASSLATTNAHDFTVQDTKFIQPSPNPNNLTRKPNGGETWEFSFEMSGIGQVKATSTSLYYYSNAAYDDEENLWWEWRQSSTGPYKGTISYSISPASPSAVEDALLGNSGDSTPGLLTDQNGGCCKGGGYIFLNFDMVADNEFKTSYGKSKSVGSFSLQIPVSASDTKDSIMQKIQDSLNDTTSLTIQSNANSATGRYYKGSARDYKIEEPVYGSELQFYAQAATESGEHVTVGYDSLSIWTLGIRFATVKTQEDAELAIDQVKGALEKVSTQRANFGAYQNRLEHTISNLDNTVENTTAADSQIRDADMAKLTMENATANILSQAGTSMIAQANQSVQGVLTLLQ